MYDFLGEAHGLLGEVYSCPSLLQSSQGLVVWDHDSDILEDVQ